MTLRLVGAGLGRTGTNSLKLALERLLEAPCYHMAEVHSHPEHVPVWQAAIRGEPADLKGTLAGYAATVDWPGAAFWEALCHDAPDAVVLLSTRSSASAWWESASATIFEGMRRPRSGDEPFAEMRSMITDLFDRRFTPGWDDPQEAMAAYEAWNAAVRAEAPADRLVEWQPGDGWEPLCAALGVAVPDEPFPHVNSTAEFRARAGYDR